MLKTCYSEGIAEAGCDEAGRGCLAGPVVAAAVILPDGFNHPLLNDSKKLSEKQRNEAAGMIRASAMAWATGVVEVEEIDRINILNASIMAIHKALDGLKILPGHILVDGNRFHVYRDILHTCIVKGDGKYTSIAAASILAKTSRDAHMMRLHKVYPVYHWDRNKGYPTKQHRQAIHDAGITEHHRRSFRLAGEQLQIGFS